MRQLLLQGVPIDDLHLFLPEESRQSVLAVAERLYAKQLVHRSVVPETPSVDAAGATMALFGCVLLYLGGVATAVALLGRSWYVGLLGLLAPDSGRSVGYHLLAVAGFAASMAVHEFGHLATSRAYSRRRGRLVVRWFAWRPIVRSRVSGIWLLPRTVRVLVAMAGPAVSAVIATVLAVAVTQFGSADNFTEFFRQLAGLNVTIALLSIVPVGRLDGYFVLSHLTDVPNLARRAQRRGSSTKHRVLFLSYRLLTRGFFISAALSGAVAAVSFAYRHMWWSDGLIISLVACALWRLARGLAKPDAKLGHEAAPARSVRVANRLSADGRR